MTRSPHIAATRKQGPGRWIWIAVLLAAALWFFRGWNRSVPVPPAPAVAGTAEPVDARAFYNVAGASGEAGLEGFDPAAAFTLPEIAANGWGAGNLVRQVPDRVGRLAAWEEAAPLGFSRSDTRAEIRIPVRAPSDRAGVLEGALLPTGLRFRHELSAGPNRTLSIPIPAACLEPGDYTLQLRLREGDRTECAVLPLVVGPHIRRDRFPTYYWLSGGSTAEELARQIRIARRLGLSMIDTPILPAVEALRNGLLVSAHLVTVWQEEVQGRYAAAPEYRQMARDQANALSDMARRYPHIAWCIPNSEYGSDRFPADARFDEALLRKTGLRRDALALDTSDAPRLGPNAVRPADGIFPHDLPELVAQRFARREGGGWFELNRMSIGVFRDRAPGLVLWTDPVFTMEQFEGFDAVSFWQYENNFYETIAQTARAECARRRNGATGVFLTLSQWYSGVTNANHTPGDEMSGYGMKSPDQHRAEAWLALTLPVHALGYWALERMEEDDECAAGLRDALATVIEPYGPMLQPTRVAPQPVAMYASSDGDFLGRRDRDKGFWYSHHYRMGVRPALTRRFKGRIDHLDDDDVLAGRLSRYRLVLCPNVEALTDRLAAGLREYQDRGGLLAGDELWKPSGLEPRLRFPGRAPEAYRLPFESARLEEWHNANSKAIQDWRPPELAGEADWFAIDTPSPDVMPALRELDGVTYAVAANLRFRKGGFSRRRGYDKATFLDQGVAQETTLRVRAPAHVTVYDAVASRPVDPATLTRDGDRIVIPASLPPGGGALFVLHPRPIASVTAAAGANGPVKAGTILFLDFVVRNDQGLTIPGQTTILVTVRDSEGRIQDVSGHYPMRSGERRIPVGIPLGARAGTWSVEAKDLTSGLTGRTTWTVTEAVQSSGTGAPGGEAGPEPSRINSRQPADAS